MNMGQLLRFIQKKPNEMKMTTVDCLKFDEIMAAAEESEGKVCFTSTRNANQVVDWILASENKSMERTITSSNVDSDKFPVLVKLNTNNTVELSAFLSANWFKVSAGLNYRLQPHYRRFLYALTRDGLDFLCT